MGKIDHFALLSVTVISLKRSRTCLFFLKQSLTISWAEMGWEEPGRLRLEVEGTHVLDFFPEWSWCKKYLCVSLAVRLLHWMCFWDWMPVHYHASPHRPMLGYFVLPFSVEKLIPRRQLTCFLFPSPHSIFRLEIKGLPMKENKIWYQLQ